MFCSKDSVYRKLYNFDNDTKRTFVALNVLVNLINLEMLQGIITQPFILNGITGDIQLVFNYNGCGIPENTL